MTFYELLFSDDETTFLFTVDKANNIVLKQTITTVELVNDKLSVYLKYDDYISIDMDTHKNKTFFKKNENTYVFLSASQAKIYYETEKNIL